MYPVFADSGYWIAILDPSDELHQRAQLVTGQLGSRRIATSEMVLVEFLNAMSKFGEHDRRLAVGTVTGIRNDSTVEMVPQSSQRFAAAIRHYSERPDQQWSLTDCASFLIMEERGIREALAYDRDFVQAGYRALLRDD